MDWRRKIIEDFKKEQAILEEQKEEVKRKILECEEEYKELKKMENEEFNQKRVEYYHSLGKRRLDMKVEFDFLISYIQS